MPYVICSKSTEQYAMGISSNCKIIVIEGRLKNIFYETIDSRMLDDLVIGIGGGSVIDYAKIVSGKRSCVAIPTTASGAAMTSHAVVWGKEKIDIATKVPVVLPLYKMIDINLPENVLNDTFVDCLCHCFESLISEKLNEQSRQFALRGIFYLDLFLKTKDINYLIAAGNNGGAAIEITPTSIIHKPSYKYTLEGLTHGEALRVVLQQKGYSKCLSIRKLYTDIVRLPVISCILDT